MSKQKQAKKDTSINDEGRIPETATVYRTVIAIDVNTIGASRFEPQARRRAKFKKEDTEKLGDSIVKSGLEQPILVRPVKPLDEFKYEYEIVFGERRWLAHKAKNLKYIDCFIKELSDSEVIERQYQENHERQDNDPLDDAFYFKYLQEKQGYSVKDLSIKFNISEKAVVNKLKFNDLIEEAKQELSDGFLPLGHALFLSKFPPETQKKIVEEQMAYRYGDKDDGACSFAEFKEEIELEILRKLADAPFNPDDPRLHIKGLICSKCPERTGYSPMLFEDAEDWENDSCLNGRCFQSKININLRLKREDIAANYAKPGDYIEDAVKKVPIVYEYGFVDKDDIPFSDVKPDDVLKNQKLYESKECESAEPALAIKGEKKGQEVYICRNKECEIHFPRNKSENSQQELSEWQREQMESEFKMKVAIQVRDQIYAESIRFFESGNSFWQYSDLVDKLLQNLLFIRRNQFEQLKLALKKFPKPPAKFDDSTKNADFVARLEPFQKSQLLFLCTFAEVGHMFWRYEPQEDVKGLAKEYTKLDYRKLEAEARVKLAPKEFKEIAEGYLLRVVNGIEEEPPKFWLKENSDADTEDSD